MGWMRTLFLGDVGNHLDIADTRQDLDAVRRTLRGSAYHQKAIDAAQDSRLAAMQEEIEDLQLMVASLSRLLVSRSVLSENDVERVVTRLDA